MKNNSYISLDSFRLAAAFLVVANHVSPLESFSLTADFILTRVIARVCVPFFLMITGFFLSADEAPPGRGRIGAVMKKTAVLYGAAVLLYLPLNFYNGFFQNPPLRIAADVLFRGTFYHLWYLPAILVILPASWLLWRAFGLRAAFAAGIVLYIVGLGGDSYYGLVSKVPFLKAFYDAVLTVAGGTRLLRAPVFLLLGCMLRAPKKRIGRAASAAGLAVCAALLIAEGLWLNAMAYQLSDRMYIMLLPCMYFLFSLLTQQGVQGGENRREPGRGKTLRSVLLVVYIVHPWFIVFVRGFAKLTGTTGQLVENRLVLFVLVCALSGAAAVALVRLRVKLHALRVKLHKPRPADTGRAWIEVSREALRHNAAELMKLLPESCRLMAVVKADAYGHGAVEVARELEKAGIQAFAVATLAEGMALRRGGVMGEVLVLGYTQPDEAKLIRRFRLTQTVVDGAYAQALHQTGQRLRVHIKVDTGMHRLGIGTDKLSELEDVFSYSNLTVQGMFTHLSAADSLTGEASDFTLGQISRFADTVGTLKSKGYRVGSIHIQESYGMLNYQGLPCDYARAGIALYGVLCKNDKTRLSPELTPALALRARIAGVKWIGAGEAVSYSMHFIAPAPMKIASVTIGYADGIPREAADRGVYVLLRGRRAPVIGLICMDILLIDVTDIDNAAPGDIVTVIGRDGTAVIRCEDAAERCMTITNELLSRLGARLPRIYI